MKKLNWFPHPHIRGGWGILLTELILFWQRGDSTLISAVATEPVAFIRQGDTDHIWIEICQVPAEMSKYQVKALDPVICVGAVACLYINFWVTATALQSIGSVGFTPSLGLCIQSSCLFCSLYHTCLIKQMCAIFSGHLLLTCGQLIHSINL